MMHAMASLFRAVECSLFLNTFLLISCIQLAHSAAIGNSSDLSSTVTPPSSSSSPPPAPPSPSTPTPSEITQTSSPTPSPPSDPESDPSIKTPSDEPPPSSNWVSGSKPKTWKARKWPTQKPAKLPLYPPYPPPEGEDEAAPDATAEATEDEDGGIIAEDEVPLDENFPRPTVIPQIECPEKKGQQAYAHPEVCDQFYLCTNGTLTLERCQNGLLFKGGPGAIHNHCHYHWDVECNERRKEMVALSTEFCEYQFGMYPEKDKDSCSNKYVVCEFGRSQLAECAPGLAYDPRSHRCNWPDEMMDLKCEPKNIVGFNCPEGMPEDPVSARFWPYPRFALKGDCQRLITCVNGHPRLITCDDGLVVDESTLTCDEPELVPECAHFAKKEENEEDASQLGID